MTQTPQGLDESPAPGSAPPPKPEPTGRAMRIALMVSLALNLIVAGTIGGMVLSHSLNPLHRIEGRLAFGPYAEALSRAERRSLAEALQRNRAAMQAQRRTLRADFDAMLQVLRRDPYDPAAMQAVMARQQQWVAGRIAFGQDLLAAQIMRMTPAERARFADRLERIAQRRAHMPFHRAHGQ